MGQNLKREHHEVCRVQVAYGSTLSATLNGRGPQDLEDFRPFEVDPPVADRTRLIARPFDNELWISESYLQPVSAASEAGGSWQFLARLFFERRSKKLGSVA